MKPVVWGVMAIVMLGLVACQSGPGQTCFHAGFNYKILVNGQSVQQYCFPSNTQPNCVSPNPNETDCTVH